MLKIVRKSKPFTGSLKKTTPPDSPFLEHVSFYIIYLKSIFVTLRLQNLPFPVFIGYNSS